MAALDNLLEQIQDENLKKRLTEEIKKATNQRKFGLVYEEHLPECTPLYGVAVKKGSTVAIKNEGYNDLYLVQQIAGNETLCVNRKTQTARILPIDDLVPVAQFGDPIYPYLEKIDEIKNAPDEDTWQTLIEADNYHALQLLAYLYPHKVDCIYIDPPYNTGAKDWKYNNDYVDSTDVYRHSKWLSFMEKRLRLAKQLLNPQDSVLICTIDEKEYLHLGMLLEQMFPEARMQMITDIINPRGTNRGSEFSRVEEYVFICRFGKCNVTKLENNMLGNTDETGKARVWYGFNRPNNPRTSANGQFYPIYIDENTKQIIKVGEPLDRNAKQSDFPAIKGLTAVFPINSHGNESIWGAVPETTREWVAKGYVRVSDYDKTHKRWTLSYIRSGLQKRIENGEIKVKDKLPDGSLNIQHINTEGEVVPPKTVWYQKSHKSYDFGSSLIKEIIPNRDFAFPKSLYSVHDALRFFVINKPNALIVDFFAGSATTLHAVNLLNAEDGGHRHCIIVTNNEVANSEAKSLTKQGYHPGDPEWERLGIAQYVAWPRTTCSIKGINVKGEPLKGDYLGNGYPDGSPIHMSDGFKANAIYFKLGFLDKNAVSLGRQFAELLPLLWMKAGAHGECPAIDRNKIPSMLILPENKMAILVKENHYSEFIKQLEQYPEIKTVYLITDSEDNYHEMITKLRGRKTYQLYRDYLDNFKVNGGSF